MRLFALLIITGVLVSGTFAQTPLEVFGYVQTSFTSFQNNWEFEAPPGEADYRYNYMGINQLNVLFAKDFGDGLSGLINFEYINNYSSANGFGSFNVQEAYIRWDYKPWLKVKFGMVIPQFNAMFEIYNKTPLLPYVLRPKLYEANTGNLVDIFNILPQRSLVHLNGAVPVGTLVFEYSAFMGNPPSSFMSSPDNDMIPGYVAYGQSAVAYLSRGGRVGFRYGDIRAGVSYATDRANQRAFVKDVDGNTVDLGDIPRAKFGADFTASLAGFTLTGEYLKVSSNTSSAIDDSLAAWNASDPYFIGKSFDKEFYFATLQYNVTDELAVYAMYDYLNDSVDPFYFGLDGYYGYHLGAYYSVNESVVLKIQMTNNHARYDTQEPVNPIRGFEELQLSAGVSYAF